MLHLVTCHGRIMPRLAELLFFSPCMKINWLVVFFCLFVFFKQICILTDDHYLMHIIIFLRKEQNSTLACNLLDSSLRIMTAIHVSKSFRTYLVIPT